MEVVLLLMIRPSVSGPDDAEAGPIVLCPALSVTTRHRAGPCAAAAFLRICG
jgi:hypothetical protein